MTTSWVQIAQEAIKIPGLLVEVYGDLARPGVKQVGKALETVVGLGNTVLWPIAWANERSRIALERNLERYRKEMESVSEEKTVSVAPEIGVPIAEKLSYVQDERLSTLYVKLLATASNSDKLENAHPSFVNVINNLSPDEAHLLEYFIGHEALPIMQAVAQHPTNGSYATLTGVFATDEALFGLAFPHNIDSYLSNLDGLGLITVNYNEKLTDEKLYEPIELKYRHEMSQVLAQAPKLAGSTLQFKRGLAKRTSFGLKFIRACHASET